MSVHQPISEDPDIAQAIDDFRELALEMRDCSKRIVGLTSSDRQRVQDEDRIRDIMSQLSLRAHRIALTADELLVFINADLGHRAQPRRPETQQEVARRLDDAAARALVVEAEAHWALSAAQIAMRQATEARIDAENAAARHREAARP